MLYPCGSSNFLYCYFVDGPLYLIDNGKDKLFYPNGDVGRMGVYVVVQKVGIVTSMGCMYVSW